MLEHIRGPEDIRRCSFEELNTLCAELREELIHSVSVTGGHLASNLGMVELTVALHNVYDPARDRIVFDVGHQCYVHKMLTGRMERFASLRQEDGLSGFPKPSESETDAFIAGHASNSVSVALGMARARTLSGGDYEVAAILGDGSLTGGLAYEGLNNAGQSREPLLIILNDNGIAINHTVGGVAKYLGRQRIKPAYYSLKRFYRKTLRKTRLGTKLFDVTQHWKNKLKAAIFSCTMFEEMGFRYLGPVDGHNVQQLSYMLNVARSYREPVLLHVVTQKGKGYPDAEAHPELYHAVGPFDPEKGAAAPTTGTCFSSVFGESLCRLAAEDKRICAITAAMEEGTGLRDFHRCFPDRFFDEGIAEGHAVSMAAGMAKQGMKPVFAVYSTFLQRSYDMLLHDVGLLGLPVLLGVDRAGLVGADGETHNGVFDVGFLRQIPGMRIWCPASFAELRDMLAEALQYDGPGAIRYPRGSEGAYREGGTDPVRALREGRDVTLVSYGIMINEVLAAADLLAEQGISARVVKLGTIAPLSFRALDSLTYDTRAVVAAEDCAGPGSVGETLCAHIRKLPVRALNLGSGIVRQGTVEQQRRRCGIDAESIARAAVELLT
ncbi:MAG: 1-deoxy-D-xylulose-5-phosphate synthase [Oscillospiraceae bacterium]|nr:1-deoxy-D-xylulose-5-phosphate synthase [Oscillospiraceae bacterium]